MPGRTPVPPETDEIAWRLRQDGLSLAAIAAQLDRREVTSPTGLGWHPTAVRRAIARHDSRHREGGDSDAGAA